ncbi:MAG: hypothetical protein M3Y48_19380 [Actinomycetota bacterium]|nr:hypothetical protein [Actinomycetota bacterium]
MDHEGVVTLLTVILPDQPKLDGANCIGKHRLYDRVAGHGHQHQRQERARLAEATRVCGGCPVRPQSPCPTTSATVVLAVGVRRTSARVRTSTPPPSGEHPAA